MRSFLLKLLLLSTTISFAQEDAWIYFNTKPNADYYLENPLEMLSQRSLDRRINQGIPVDYKDVPLDENYINTIAQSEGIEVKAKSKWLNCVHVRGETEDILNLNNLTIVDTIVFANKNISLSNDPPNTQQRYNVINKNLDIQIDYLYGNSENQIQMLNGHFMHQENFTGNGMLIAVIDSGFPGVDTSNGFQHLITNNRIIATYDFVSKSENVFQGNNHGTLVLSTIGGFIENEIIGTAPDASFLLFISEDVTNENPVEESNWVEAAEMADYYGADIINTSLGYFLYDNPDYNHTYEDMNGTNTFISKGLEIAHTRGMICITSAGNSGMTANPHITAPADAVNSLTVGAVDSTGNYVNFSSIGPSYDERIKPDVVAQGQSVFLITPSGILGAANGTSFSAPITAGLTACLWQAFPDKSNLEIINMIKNSASIYENPTYLIGYGIPDFQFAYQENLLVETQKKSEIKIYPNPASNTIFIDLINKNQALLKLFDSFGRMILQENINEKSIIDLENIPSGIYFYIIESGDNKFKGKIVKQ